jgi:hypothetical protein
MARLVEEHQFVSVGVADDELAVAWLAGGLETLGDQIPVVGVDVVDVFLRLCPRPKRPVGAGPVQFYLYT